MNKKGFTLVELLASLVILSIIMLIAVPSTLSVLDKNKKDSYISDSKKMITLAESEFRINDAIEYPKSNEIVLLYLSYINNGDLEEDPEGYTYSNDSYVAITYNGSADSYKYDYHVQLFGVKNTKSKGVILSNEEELNSDQRYTKVISDISSKNNTCASISQKVFGHTNGICRNYK